MPIFRLQASSGSEECPSYRQLTLKRGPSFVQLEELKVEIEWTGEKENVIDNEFKFILEVPTGSSGLKIVGLSKVLTKDNEKSDVQGYKVKSLFYWFFWSYRCSPTE